MMSVLIAGAGPAGLAAATRTKHAEATILERAKKLGTPPHCTGITSPSTAELLLGLSTDTMENEGLLEATYRKAVFLDKSLRETCSLEASPLAVKLRRPGIEDYLAAKASNMGHRVLLATRLLGANASERHVEATIAIEGTVKKLRAQRLLLATGAQSNPWRQKCWRTIGLEERVRLARRISDDEFTTIHGTPLAPGFFAWLAPLQGGREAVIGLASPTGKGLAARLAALRRLLARRGIAEPTKVLSRRGGLILRGPPAPRATHGALALLGDTLCASKPYTGGGLYAISRLAPAAAKWLETGEAAGLEERWRSLSNELALQLAATRLATATPSLFLRLLRAACSRATKGKCRIDYDRHTSIAACLALVPVRIQEAVLLNRGP